MRTYGFHNRITHTCVHVKLSVETQRALHILMLSLKHPLSKDQLDAHDRNCLQVKTSKFSGHHLIRGTSALMQLSERLKRDLPVQTATFVEVPPSTESISFLCPQGHARNALDQFDPYWINKSIWCPSCRGPHASTAWSCGCGRAWHNCPVHLGVPLHAPARHKPQGHGTKHQRADDAQTSARKLARLEPSVASRLILTPRLAQRFPHLAQSGNTTGDSKHNDDAGPGPQDTSGSGAQWPHSHM